MSYRPQYYDSNIYMQSTNLILKAADLYYNQGMRQQEISEQLEISVSTVSRLLKKAKEQEIVRFTIDQKYLECLTLEEALCRRYGLREVIVAPIPAESTELRLEEKKKIVALEGARYLQRVVSDHDVIGVAYGETVWYVYNYLNPCQRHDSQFVTLHGVLEHETNRLDGSWLVPRIAKAFGGKSYTINCKGLQSSREGVLRSLSEPDICRVFEQFPKITVSISGVGLVDVNARQETVPAARQLHVARCEAGRAGVGRLLRPDATLPQLPRAGVRHADALARRRHSAGELPADPEQDHRRRRSRKMARGSGAAARTAGRHADRRPKPGAQGLSGRSGPGRI